MAPEHIRGGVVGPPADVFALGAVLCHAAGVRPFGDTGPAHTLMYRIVHEEPDLTGLPDGLRDLVAACLAKDPAARPAPAQILTWMGLDGAAGPIGEWLPARATQMVDRYQSDNLHTPPPAATTPVPGVLPPAPAAPPPYSPAPYAPAYAPAPQLPPPPPGARKTWPRWAGIAAIGVAATVVFGLVLALNSGSSDPSAPSASAGGEEPAVEHCSFEGKQVTVPQGRLFDTWSCPTAQQGPLFLKPESGTTTGYIKSSSNWFVCQTDGAANPEGKGTTWLYTQGDDRYKNGGWGWFPASSVSPTWADQPVPDIPACTF
jgi:serine/threonine protein kinase